MKLIIIAIIVAVICWGCKKYGKYILQGKEMLFQIEIMYIFTIIIELCRAKYVRNSLNRQNKYMISLEKDREDFYSVLSRGLFVKKEEFVVFYTVGENKIRFNKHEYLFEDFLKIFTTEMEQFCMGARFDLVMEEAYAHIAHSLNFYFNNEKGHGDMLSKTKSFHKQVLKELEGIVDQELMQDALEKQVQGEMEEAYGIKKEKEYFDFIWRNMRYPSRRLIRIIYILIKLIFVREIYLFMKPSLKKLSLKYKKIWGTMYYLYIKMLKEIFFKKKLAYSLVHEWYRSLIRGKVEWFDLSNIKYISIVNNVLIPEYDVDAFIEEGWNSFLLSKVDGIEIYFNHRGEQYIFTENNIENFCEKLAFDGKKYNIKAMWFSALNKYLINKKRDKEKMINFLTFFIKQNKVDNVFQYKVKEKVFLKELSLGVVVRMKLLSKGEKSFPDVGEIIREYYLWKGKSYSEYGNNKVVLVFIQDILGKCGIYNKVYWGCKIYTYWNSMEISNIMSRIIETILFVGGIIVLNWGKVYNKVGEVITYIQERIIKGVGRTRWKEDIIFIYSQFRRERKLVGYRMEGIIYFIYNLWKKYVLLVGLIYKLRGFSNRKIKWSKKRDTTLYNKNGELYNILEKVGDVKNKRFTNELEHKMEDMILKGEREYCEWKKWDAMKKRKYNLWGENCGGRMFWDGYKYITIQKRRSSRNMQGKYKDKYGIEQTANVGVSEKVWSQLKGMNTKDFSGKIQELGKVQVKWSKKWKGVCRGDVSKRGNLRKKLNKTYEK